MYYAYIISFIHSYVIISIPRCIHEPAHFKMTITKGIHQNYRYRKYAKITIKHNKVLNIFKHAWHNQNWTKRPPNVFPSFTCNHNIIASIHVLAQTKHEIQNIIHNTSKTMKHFHFPKRKIEGIDGILPSLN